MSENATKAAPEPVSLPRSEFREVIYAYIVIVIGVAITANLVPPSWREYLYSIVLAAMVYLPVLRSEKRRRRLSDYGIHLKGWKREIGFALLVMLIVFPPFIIGNHLWQGLVYHRELHPGLPHDFLPYLIIEHTLFIALPEEFFYRGWMQSVFSRRWPSRFRIWGGDFGVVVWLTSALFAIGHLASIPSGFRLAVFFPSLLFCWMRSKRGSIISPILFHGMSNVLMTILNASYH